MRNLGLFSMLIALCACAREPEELPSQGTTPQATDQAVTTQEYAAFEVSWPRPSSAEVDAHATTLAEALLDRKVSERPFTAQLANASRGDVSFSATIGQASTLVGRYRRGADELLLNNRELQMDGVLEPEVGESVARTRFVETVKRLGEATLIDASLYDVNQAIFSRTLTGHGSSDTSDRIEHVQSYDFLVRQNLNGIPFVNAGVRVRVHRSGAIASLRVGGARVAATLENGRLHPAKPGYVFRATVDEKYYESRFASEFPLAHISNKGVLYMLPHSVEPLAGKKYVLEPKYVFTFSNRHGDIVSRVRHVAYSLSEPTKAFDELSHVADPNAKGDPRPAPTSSPMPPSGSVEK